MKNVNIEIKAVACWLLFLIVLLWATSCAGYRPAAKNTRYEREFKKADSAFNTKYKNELITLKPKLNYGNNKKNH